MKQLEDMYGREIKLGNYVMYSVKESTSVSTHTALVWKITWENDHYSIGVISTSKEWDWNRPAGNRVEFKAYKTMLTSNDTLVNLSDLTISDKVLKAIKEYDH